MATKDSIIEALQSDFGFPLETSIAAYDLFAANHDLFDFSGMRNYPAADIIHDYWHASQVRPYELIPNAKSAATAYHVEDYPFGNRLRCRIRYWVETAMGGAKEKQQRQCWQTTVKSFNINYTDMTPDERLAYKAGDLEWNKVKYSTYSNMVLLYKDNTEHGYVKAWHLTVFNGPKNFYLARDMFGAPQYRVVNGEEFTNDACQLSPEQQRQFIELERVNRKMNPSAWQEYLRDSRASTVINPQPVSTGKSNAPESD
jgi:hypothetical protein